MTRDGIPDRAGAHIVDDGAAFAVYAPDASLVELCLFDQRRGEHRHALNASTQGFWHGFMPGVGAGQRYGFRAHGSYAPDEGLRFNAAKLLLDPYAREFSGEFTWSNSLYDHQRPVTDKELLPCSIDNASDMPLSVVTAAPDRPASRVHVPWDETLIYELNVRGFSMQHPEIPADHRGLFSALGCQPSLDHLKALGITSVELLPIHAFVDENFLTRKGLRNYWGYNSIGFFAPASRYLGPNGIDGLKAAVAALHEANIEVILDVVYNHTAEGGRLGPSFSFRGLANKQYYRLLPNDLSEYINDTGCGNTINTDEPVVRDLIVNSLRYWVEAIGIDGFRFDLAATLGRTATGFATDHALFRAIADDPVLQTTKLIAEPWDIGPGGYRIGAFPEDWSEWNDQYRDTVRSFWRGDSGAAPELARRVHGSADIFEPGGRDPRASINFISSHDGFTLADLVSYNDKHNEANGEQNLDGHSHNLSVNHGVEGPTEDENIRQQRLRHSINLLATLLFSQGTPMLLAGDEFGNSQSGNNNAYAQDNPMGWLDWEQSAESSWLFAEACKLSQVRRDLGLLRQPVYRHDEISPVTGLPCVDWFDADGNPIDDDHWPAMDTLGVLLSDAGDTGDPSPALLAVAVIFNRSAEPVDLQLPRSQTAGQWQLRYASGKHCLLTDNGSFSLEAFSIACLSLRTI